MKNLKKRKEEKNRIRTMRNSNAIFLGLTAAILLGCGGTKQPDPAATAKIYGSRASAAFNDGNLSGALADYKRAYVAAARADVPRYQAQCLFNVGRVYYELGYPDSAEQAFGAAQRDFVFYGDDASARMAAGFLALVLCQRGMYDQAFSWYEKGRPAVLKDRSETAFWLTVQAQIAMLKSRVPEALGYLDKAMECYARDKKYNGMAQVDYYRALVAYSQSQYADAADRLASSLASLDKASQRYRRWRVLLAAATVSFCRNEEEQGQRFYRRAQDCVAAGISLPPLDSIRTCPKRFHEGYR
jgi:tetratricopeptide (TPR) repeat protein